MSIARRLAKCSSACLRCAGQNSPPLQRATASSSPRTTCEPHTGQVGNLSSSTKRGGSPLRRSSTGATTSGITSPARRTITQSPMRTSLRSISSWLCSVALVTVTPPTKTGSRRATGVSAPVRPTCTSMSRSSVTASCAGYLCATAQRGSRVTKPSCCCSARELTLYTTPSMSKGSVSRSAPMRAWKSASPCAPCTTARCSHTGSPKAAITSSTSACVAGGVHSPVSPRP